MNNQFKWDVFLITHFFKYPHYRMSGIFNAFKSKYGVDDDTAENLLRIPIHGWHFKSEVYGFVAQFIPNIYRKIESKQIDDVFDIASYLNKLKIDTRRDQTLSSRRAAQEACGNYKKIGQAAGLSHRLHLANNDAHSRRNWAACK